MRLFTLNPGVAAMLPVGLLLLVGFAVPILVVALYSVMPPRTFALDGEPVLTRRRPPYTVELDLGQIPRARTLSVTGYDAEGEEVARDEMLLNAGGNRFSVDLVEPRKGRTYTDSLRAEAQVETPEGVKPERVEFFLNETKVATLYQEP